MSSLYAIANQKGGVGKTTTAINLAVALTKLRKKNSVLLIDLDPQGNASAGIGADNTQVNGSFELLLGEASFEECLQKNIAPGLDMISANAELAAAEVSMATQTHENSEQNSRFRLREALDGCLDHYTYVLIDCPPSLNLLTINALIAAEFVLIPMQCEYFALEGLSGLINTINRIREHSNRQLRLEGLVRTMVDNRSKLTQSVSQQLEDYFPDIIYDTQIPRNIRLAEAPSHAISVLDYDAASKGAKAYMKLAKEMDSRAKKRAKQETG